MSIYTPIYTYNPLYSISPEICRKPLGPDSCSFGPAFYTRAMRGTVWMGGLWNDQADFLYFFWHDMSDRCAPHTRKLLHECTLYPPQTAPGGGAAETTLSKLGMVYKYIWGMSWLSTVCYLLTLSVSRRSFEGSFYIKYSYSSQLFVNSFCQWVLI